ncbi:MAG TPA: hypothetical protein VFK05_01670 [Polyangiaceae bacterium]|nr:hypothetical protein [Polyangiaceae bacterium]
MSTPELDGPLEGAAAFPARLSARIITAGERPLVHGYDVEGDLALHYQPTDLLFLMLMGELPSEPVSRAFGVAWMFLAPVSVAHASTHAAVVGRLCGSPPSGMFGVAAIGAAEHARSLLDEHEELFSWLRAQRGPLPQRFRARDTAEQAAVERLERALERTGFSLPVLSERPSRDAALLMLLFTLGIKRPERLQAAIMLARVPSAIAEALAERPTNFGNYPINLPRFAYTESAHEST